MATCKRYLIFNQKKVDALIRPVDPRAFAEESYEGKKDMKLLLFGYKIQ
tara:strand:+ start:1066 stop:1212 length:147 start_codon:yes stop_codon:yes gene_type:complete